MKKNAKPEAAPAVPEVVPPHALINRAWGKMPYAGGMGIRYIDENDTPEQIAEKTAANLDKLAGTLRHVAEESRRLENERNTMRNAVRGFGALMGMAADLQGKRYSLTMRSTTTGGTHAETISIYPGQDAEQEAARHAAQYGAVVEKLDPL